MHTAHPCTQVPFALSSATASYTVGFTSHEESCDTLFVVLAFCYLVLFPWPADHHHPPRLSCPLALTYLSEHCESRDSSSSISVREHPSRRPFLLTIVSSKFQNSNESRRFILFFLFFFHFETNFETIAESKKNFNYLIFYKYRSLLKFWTNIRCWTNDSLDGEANIDRGWKDLECNPFGSWPPMLINMCGEKSFSS